MKTQLFFALFILAIVPVRAQKIHFTDSTNVWNVATQLYNDGSPLVWYETHKVLGDTSIAAKQYRQVNFDVDGFYSGLSFIREDTTLGKVYIRDTYNDSDVVLIDYNITVGDTFTTYSPVPASMSPINHKYALLSLDSTLIQGTWHKVWNFSRDLTNHLVTLFPSFFVIEGIGCIHHPTYLVWRGAAAEPPIPRITCFVHDSTIPLLAPPVPLVAAAPLYRINDSVSCLGSTLPVSTQNGSVSASLSPNPATSMLTVSSVQKIKTLLITNCLSQVVHTAITDSNTVPVDVSDFPPGLYFIRINNTEVRKFVKQ